MKKLLFSIIAFITLTPIHSMQNRPNAQYRLNAQLCVSAYDLNFIEFKKALDGGADVNFKYDGGYALHKAVGHNYSHWWDKSFDVCQLLLQKGADPNVEDYNGYTPLMKAAWKDGDRCENAKLLLTYGACPDKKDKEGKTALHHAAIYGKTRLCKILLKKNADPNERDSKGATPLWYAIKNNEKVICEFLLHFGANPNLDSYLAYAADEQKTDICKLLLKYDALVNAQFPGEATALHMAACRKNEDICWLLMDYLSKECEGILLLLMWLRKTNTNLYNQRCVLRPYFEIYSLDRLLRAQDGNGKMACDYWPVCGLLPYSMRLKEKTSSE